MAASPSLTERLADRAAVLWQALFPDAGVFYGRFHGPIARGAPPAGQVTVTTGREPLWLNLGYWQDVEQLTPDNFERWGELLEAAQQQMARLVADTAGLGPDDQVLDCGCGHGDQDLLWLEEYGPRQIIGLDITPENVAVASQRAELLGCRDRLDFRLGSATRMPFETASFDVVLALECAFHFNTRQRFLAEAFRVLGPGGRLVLADMHRNRRRRDGLRVALRRAMERRFAHIPTANLCDSETYRTTVERVGFRDVTVRSLSDSVWRPYDKVLFLSMREQRGLPVTRRVVEQAVRHFDTCSADRLFLASSVDLDEYSLVSAVKSEGATLRP